MNRKILLSCGLIVLMAAVGALWAQEAEPPAEEEASPLVDEEVDVSGIEQILRGEEEVLEGRIFSYDPAGRRDPFRSLLEGFEETEEGPAKARPPGLPGMMIEELRLAIPAAFEADDYRAQLKAVEATTHQELHEQWQDLEERASREDIVEKKPNSHAALGCLIEL